MVEKYTYPSAGTGVTVTPLQGDDSNANFQPITSTNPMPVTGTVAVGGVKSTTATLTQVAASVAVGGVTLLAANSARLGATIWFSGAAILYVSEGAGTPSATNYTGQLGAGLPFAYECPPGFTGAIKGIWSAAVGSANVTERTA